MRIMIGILGYMVSAKLGYVRFEMNSCANWNREMTPLAGQCKLGAIHGEWGQRRQREEGARGDRCEEVVSQWHSAALATLAVLRER